MKKIILKVEAKRNKEGKTIVAWDFPQPTNIYFLIGVIEEIKQDLLKETIEYDGEDSDE